MANGACRFATPGRKEGGFFFSFFFLQNKQNKEHAHAETHNHDDQRNAGIARICYRGLSHPCFQGGAMMSPTQTGSSFVVTVVQQRTVSLSFVVVVPLLLEVLFPPLSLNPCGLPVASSFLSSILRWKKLKKTTRSLSLFYSNGKNVNILRGCLAWRYWEACLRAEPCSWRGVAAVLLRLASQGRCAVSGAGTSGPPSAECQSPVHRTCSWLGLDPPHLKGRKERGRSQTRGAKVPLDPSPLQFA